MACILHVAPGAYMESDHTTHSTLQVQQLARSKKWDVFINLCDGGFDEDRAGIEVVHTLERCA